MFKNEELNFKVHTTSMGLLGILFEDGIFSYYNGNEMVEIGDEKKLYKFLYQNKASYVDEGQNLRALVLSYEASQAALFEGHLLRDKTGSTYELDPETGMILIDGGDVKFRQLPFTKYMLDIQRNIEMKEGEERQREEEECRQAELELSRKTPKKKSNFWTIAAAFSGLVLVGSATYFIVKK